MVGRIFQIVVSKVARGRIKEICEYYTQKASPSVSQKVRQGIFSAAKELETLPDSKPVIEGSEKLLGFKVHYTKAWSFKILFRIVYDQDKVRILTVRHDKEAPEKLLTELKNK